MTVVGSDQTVYLSDEVVLSNEDVASSRVVSGPSGSQIEMVFLTVCQRSQTRCLFNGGSMNAAGQQGFTCSCFTLGTGDDNHSGSFWGETGENGTSPGPCCVRTVVSGAATNRKERETR